ncbi:cytochrome P450 [Gloeopeniophorella convolvens]|nr:cytochrome P450 [Gloeopeniophorella convolvens]
MESIGPRLSLTICLAVFWVIRYVKSPWRKVPRGPKGFPIIGNALDLRDKRWLFEKRCKEDFGDLLYLNAIGQPILVLNSLKAAGDLLDQRADIYSDRPRLIVPGEILSGGLFSAFISYSNDLFRPTRRAAHEGLTKLAVRDYHTILSKEAAILSSALLETPQYLEKHIQRTSASATMSILYDYPTLDNENDGTLKKIHTFIDRMSRATAPGAHLVELFPWMLNIPRIFAKWKRVALQHYEEHNALFEGLFSDVQDGISNGSERPSISASLIKNSDRNGLSSHEMAWLMGTLYSAGAETTSTSISWWLLAMVAFPEFQKRAQEELDAVVGRTRIPTFADAERLPYIQAMVKETLRWRPPLPLSIPHSTTQDNWYNGMFIPKGTMCLPNVWHCNHDPAVFGEDADMFNPERYLDAQGNLVTGPAEARDGHCTYGFGRRACVGKHLANDSLFLYMATVLWAMNIERPRNQDGEEISLDVDTVVDAGMVFRPLPYECKTTPRFPEVVPIIEGEIELPGL